MAMFKVSFTVVGKGPFPLDMLRYDQCHPVNPDAVSRMWSVDTTQNRSIRLARYFNSDKNHLDVLFKQGLLVTWQRWLSFGWGVLVHDIKITPIPKL